MQTGAHHLLEEIYYNAVIDEATVPIGIAANNLALKDVLELAVLDSSELADDELFGRLDHIFAGSDWYTGSFNPAGYVRLINTPLSIPFDETLLSLDHEPGGCGRTPGQTRLPECPPPGDRPATGHRVVAGP
jgi:hypothetical protein